MNIEQSPAEGVFVPDIEYTLEKVSERLQEQYDNRVVYSGIYNQALTLNEPTIRTSLFIQDSSRCTIVVQSKINNISLVNCDNIRIIYPSLVNKFEAYKCSEIHSLSRDLPSVTQIDSCNGIHLVCNSIKYLKNYHICCVFTTNVSLKVHFLTYTTNVPVECGLYPTWQYSTFVVMTYEKVYARPYTIHATHERNQVTSMTGKGSIISA